MHTIVKWHILWCIGILLIFPKRKHVVCLFKFYNRIVYAQRLYCRLKVDLLRTWMEAMPHWPLTAHCHVCLVHPESGRARGLLRHLTAPLASAAACSCPCSTAGSTASLNSSLQVISFHLCLRPLAYQNLSQICTSNRLPFLYKTLCI